MILNEEDKVTEDKKLAPKEEKEFLAAIQDPKLRAKIISILRGP